MTEAEAPRVCPTVPLRKAGTVIAIASGKGGVGKTWLSITLAHALVRAQHRVLLLDCDMGLANVDIQLGLMAQSDIGSVLHGHAPLGEALVHHSSGLDILTGRSGSGDLSALGETHVAVLRNLIEQARGAYDFIMLDLGAGLDRFIRSMSCAADLLLVVGTSEPTSLTDAYAVLKLYQQDRRPGSPNARLVINQADTGAAGARTYATLAKATESFLSFVPELAGVIRRDDKIKEAIRRQTPLLERWPGCVAASDVEAIAASLTPHSS